MMQFYRSHILVCSGSNCSLRGSRAVREALVREVAAAGLAGEVKVVETGCFGLCEQGPTMIIYPEGVLYCKVTEADVSEIVRTHLLKGRRVERLLYQEPTVPKAIQLAPEVDYFKKQQRIVLKNCGTIDPESIDEYIANNGYEALGRAVTGMSPDQVIEEIKGSKLRGRGGAGFPTGLKWSSGRKAPGETKYIICNADEGEPGTSKDRLILEGDPHAVLEGMAIAGYAVGACQGFVYIRGEYVLAIERLQKAIDAAREYGLLGSGIFGSEFSFDIEIRTGAGAYVCGEETALIESMEGNRGEPRIKPPYPTDSGLWGCPTVVNNVETLANVPPIILNGAAWFAAIGSPNSPGTKVFTLSGDIVNKGLIEVPMGITLREIVYEIGGGIPGGRTFKMAQTGGTSGGCLPGTVLDVPLDADSLIPHGSGLGSGALLVIDDTHCVVDMAIAFARFFAHESCGKCTPCREGTPRFLEILQKIAAGQGRQEDLALLEELARVMLKAPLCPLGQTVPVPIMTTIRHFRAEYDAHINQKTCPTGVCQIGAPAVAD